MSVCVCVLACVCVFVSVCVSRRESRLHSVHFCTPWLITDRVCLVVWRWDGGVGVGGLGGARQRFLFMIK